MEPALYCSPFNAGGIDWIKANNDGNYSHYAEPRHATDAITEEAVSMIQEHKNKQPSGTPSAPLLWIVVHAPTSRLCTVCRRRSNVSIYCL